MLCSEKAGKILTKSDAWEWMLSWKSLQLECNDRLCGDWSLCGACERSMGVSDPKFYKVEVSILTFGSIALVIVEQDVIHIFIVL